MQVAGLQAHDRGSGDARQSLLQRVGHQAPLVVRGHDLRLPQPEVAQRKVHGDVSLSADQDADARCSCQPPPVEIPARVGQHLLPPGRETGEVGHCPPGDEADVRPVRQAQQVQDPPAGDLLHDHRSWRRVPQTAVLVPRAGQPVRAERGGQRPTHHPPEEPSGRDRHQPRLDRVRQHVDDGGGVAALVGQRPIEVLKQPVGVSAGRHRAGRQRREPLPGPRRRTVEGCFVLFGRQRHASLWQSRQRQISARPGVPAPSQNGTRTPSRPSPRRRPDTRRQNSTPSISTRCIHGSDPEQGGGARTALAATRRSGRRAALGSCPCLRASVPPCLRAAKRQS